MSVKVGSYTISQGGFQNTRSELITAAIFTGGQQGQSGHTQGSTAAYTNSLAPTAGTAMTNTAPGPGTGLGGQFSALPTLGAGTDGILCSYQNPVPSAAIVGRTLVIKGVRIDSVVTTVLAGGPVIYLYSLCYGHTNVSLATTEGANAKAPRRIPLGIQQFAATAAVGVQPTAIYVPFDRPIPVNPTEFVAIAAKNIGTITSAGVITFLVTYDYGWIL
jgi:hypothetical protein